MVFILVNTVRVFDSVNTKVSSKLVHEEKVRRIKEEEQMLNEDNPARTAMMNLMNRVQRQMLLQKFKGKWVSAHAPNSRIFGALIV